MAKGYWIAHVDVDDADGYAKYVSTLPAIMAKHGGRYLVRRGRHEIAEGAGRSRNLVIEFPSYEQALACYRSPEYQTAAAHRKASAATDLMIIEGYNGPQPGD